MERSSRKFARTISLGATLWSILGAGCSEAGDSRSDAGRSRTASITTASATAEGSASGPTLGVVATAGSAASSAAVAPAAPSGAPAAHRGEPGAHAFRPLDAPLHAASREELLALVDVTVKKTSRMDPDRFLAKVVSPEGPGKMNQGNPAIAEHAVARAACLEGLKAIVLQTPEQKAACGGRENMVPIYKDGDPAKAKTCVDLFEYPNKPCELPVVWVPPTHANALCELAGKRLCRQDEWVLACGGDPSGGPRQEFAYGKELDLAACNTQKSAKGSACDADSVKSAWKTCPTRTEPAGSFPKCRSRFGVFDLHGNVAEAMTRMDDGKRVSQLKGSAWFYVDVARKPGDEPTKENYADHCAHDPRWHVEPMRDAMHSNYHLGFRCCAAATPQKP